MKKLVVLLMVLSMMVSLVACGNKEAAEGTATTTETVAESGKKDVHVFMFKSTGNKFGDLMNQGFEKAVTAAGGEAQYVSPAETTAAAQVSLVEELIAKGVKSITISANDADAFNAIATLAESNDVKLLSADSAINAGIRVSHTIPVTIDSVGRHLVYAAIMIMAQEPYTAEMDMKAKAEEILAANKFAADPIKMGVLSATTTSPVQNQWIAAMEKEIARLDAAYPGNLADANDGSADSMLDIKYGNDDPQDSTTQANAFISEDKVDMIIAPTTVGMFAAGQQLQGNTSSKIKLTGLGLPSEMANFMPTSAADEFTAVCPYMMLWNVIDLGSVAGAAAVNAVSGTYDGQIGSKFDYDGKTYDAIQDPDSAGSVVVVGDPYVFFQGNMAEWKDTL